MGPDLESLSDEELVARFRERGERDDRPFTELFRRHHTTIWQLCYRTLGTREEADDVTQHVFLNAFRRLSRFEGRAAFGSWLYQIAMNLCRNEIRRRRRRPGDRATTARLEDLPLVGGFEADTATWTRDRRQSLGRALKHLRPEEAELLRLIFVEGRSYRDIATTLGIGLSAAKMRAQRARDRLRNVLEELGAPGEWAE